MQIIDFLTRHRVTHLRVAPEEIFSASAVSFSCSSSFSSHTFNKHYIPNTSFPFPTQNVRKFASVALVREMEFCLSSSNYLCYLCNTLPHRNDACNQRQHVRGERMSLKVCFSRFHFSVVKSSPITEEEQKLEPKAPHSNEIAAYKADYTAAA